MARVPSRVLKSRLESLLRTYDARAHVASDPVSFVHTHSRSADRELVGLLAASLAFGNVAAIRASVRKALLPLGPHPAGKLDDMDPRQLGHAYRAFVHRIYKGPQIARLLHNASVVRRDEGSLGAAFEASLDRSRGDLREGLALFADRLRGSRPSRAMAHLVPDPRAGSACKRLLLYLRWMIRPADGVDLGVWPIAPSILIIPVDTHILRISRNLGLTQRATASWRTAEEITATLRRFDPEDPVKYDFALCHLGVSRQCPSRRDESLCAQCLLRPACLHWKRRPRSP